VGWSIFWKTQDTALYSTYIESCLQCRIHKKSDFLKEINRRTVCRSPEPEPEDPPRGEDQAGECGAQGGSHGAQGPATQVGCFLLLV
jgi:hypothetical protein